MLHKWLNILKEGGGIAPKKGYQKGHSHKIKNMEEFKEFIDNKNKGLRELARISGLYKRTTIWRGIQKLGYSYKKTFTHLKRDKAAREQFIKMI